ncbi:MAG: RHS repeat-associated core domain-containing protein [Vicinamibacterales bacterium]
MVTLIPQPDPDSTFSGWTGACSGTGACQAMMAGARFASASFARVPTAIDTTYYHTDVIGSVRALTDATGAVLQRHDYLPFGEDAAPMTGDPMRFTGKELDPETALQNLGARYLRNSWGRFSRVDPLHVGAAMTDPATVEPVRVRQK